MIINQNVCVAMTSKNVEHFKSKGFEPEYYIDKEKKTRLRRKKITVNVSELRSQSKVKVDVRCDNCGNIFKKEYGFALKNNNHFCCNECQSQCKKNNELSKFGFNPNAEFYNSSMKCKTFLKA